LKNKTKTAGHVFGKKRPITTKNLFHYEVTGSILGHRQRGGRTDGQLMPPTRRSPLAYRKYIQFDAKLQLPLGL